MWEFVSSGNKPPRQYKIDFEDMNDAEFRRLKEQIQTGDERGLRFVFEQTSRYCIRTLTKKTHCTDADAEDIFMDSILIFRENILSGRLTQLTNLKTYVFGICWNLWRDLNRSQSRWERNTDEMERQLWIIMNQENHDEELRTEFLQTHIRQVKGGLEALGEKCRKLLAYVYVEQRPQREIAKLMGFANAGVVKVSRHRCYQKWILKIEELKTLANGK